MGRQSCATYLPYTSRTIVDEAERQFIMGRLISALPIHRICGRPNESLRSRFRSLHRKIDGTRWRRRCCYSRPRLGASLRSGLPVVERGSPSRDGGFRYHGSSIRRENGRSTELCRLPSFQRMAVTITGHGQARRRHAVVITRDDNGSLTGCVYSHSRCLNTSRPGQPIQLQHICISLPPLTARIYQDESNCQGSTYID